MDVAALTFDFHETLVYPWAGHGRGYMLKEYLRSQGIGSDPWEHQVLYDVFEPHTREYDPSAPPAERERYLARFAERVFDRLGVCAPQVVPADHAHQVWDVLGPASLAVFPDVRDTLARLRDGGFKMAVVSNWQCGLGHFCTELGLRGWFDGVLASAEVGSAKPDSGIFGAAAECLDLPPQRILHVGDNPVDDWEGGRNAGFQVVLIDRDQALIDHDAFTIPSLDLLPELLEVG